MIYITGDTHSDVSRFMNFCSEKKTTRDDIMIILGDAGLNYHVNFMDELNKAEASAYPLTYFCIHGNHECRPSAISTYKTKEFCGGTVWYEEKYPHILFAKDGEIYNLGGYECIVLGGAYSVDKDFRLRNGWQWFSDEQPSDEIKAYAEQQLAARGNRIDVVLSHTCPRKYEPVETFFPGIDQSTVDKTTEDWLDSIEESLEYKRWYCGHYHIEKSVDRLRMTFEAINEFMKD